MLRSAFFLLFVLLACTQGRNVRKVPLTRDHRIVNGVPAQLGEFPSQLSFQVYEGHYCGASILNEYWAVTAAHCVDGWSPQETSVVAGTVDLLSGGSRHQVEAIIPHESYDAYDSWKNDIALLKVSTPFAIGGNVQPVKLPIAGDSPADGSTATVIGWGALSEGGSSPTDLQKVDIAVVNQDVCNNIYGGMGYPVYEGHICAGEGEKGSCNGDSGGPLFVDGTVVGLVSWAMGCSRPDYPTVYTRVAEYRDWITLNSGV